MKKLLTITAFAVTASAYAVIPGYGLNYGQNNLYMYEEYNCNAKNSNDQFFLSFLEYGVTDWFDLQLQAIDYPDGSYDDLSIGGCLQFWKSDWLNLRGGAMYDFGTRAPNGKADSMCYSVTCSGEVWNGFGYIYQAQCVHACHGGAGKPDWLQQAYLTYSVTDSLVPYVSVTADLRHVDETTDFSVGGWYTLFNDRFGLQWANLYFDVANLTERYEDIRISIGIDFLF